MPDNVPAVARSEFVQRCTELYWTDSLAGEPVHLLLCQLKHEIGVSSSSKRASGQFPPSSCSKVRSTGQICHNANNLRFDTCVATPLV